MDIGALVPTDRDVEGIVEMMLDATQNFAEPLTEERLFAWHAALFPTGRSGMARIMVGTWRSDKTRPMQVVSGPLGHERIHYEAPSAAKADRSGARGCGYASVVRHHPSLRGRERSHRPHLADMALAHSEGSPRRFYSMSAQIRVERKAYYDILENAQKGDLYITPWIGWFLGCLDRAIAGAEVILASVLKKARFWEVHAGVALNDRQRAIVNRLLGDFEGKLTSSKYAKFAKCSQDTAARDIDDLVKHGMLVKNPGGGRSTSYSLARILA